MIRREFLKLGGAGAAGVLFVPLLNGCEHSIIAPLRSPERTPFLTPVSRFFEQHGGQGALENWKLPVFESEKEWRLSIEGLRGELLLPVTWDMLMEAAETETVTILKTIECIVPERVRLTDTGFTGNAYWTGVPLKRFLDQAGIDYDSPDSEIKRFVLTGSDGFYHNVTRERIADAERNGLEQPLLAYRMNGRPLPPEHGFPVRLIVQEAYGFKNIKWIAAVRATRYDEIGTYYDSERFVDDADIRVNSRSTNFFDEIEIPAGRTLITGFALSGYAPIGKVEVRIDDGPAQAAELIPLEEIRQVETLPSTIKQLAEGIDYPFRAVWTPWRLEWRAPVGTHTVTVRAFDAAGNVQPDTDGSIHDGYTAVATYRVNVV